MEKVLLVILDGFGINTKTPEENAIIQAKTPTFHALFSDLHTKLDASGRAVGLPDGQMGNSEVGHMTIGTGRIIKQNLVAIEDMIDDGSFGKLPSFLNGIEHCKKNKSNLHILQLFGSGGVHAMDSHLKKILPLIPKDINVYLHLFADGRDLEPKSAAAYMQEFETYLEQFPNVVIASLSGRYYGMDRDNNRERVQKSYDEIMFGQLQTNDLPSEYIAKSYEKELTDEFLIPVSFMDGEQIEDGDAIFFLNFRSDRARQMTQALVASMNPEKTKNYIDRNSKFMTKSIRNIYLATMTKYYKEYDGNVFVKAFDIKNTLGEVVSSNEKKQLHVAETEKFAHVTKFFNGDKQIVYNGEKDILVPSHKVATYDLDPEMSAQEIYDQLIENIKSYDFTIVNFANGDMVGHTGILPAAEQAVKKLDTITKNLIDFCKKNTIHLLITADHGNCEEMGTLEIPKTAHTTNLVPFWYIINGKTQKTKATGGLSDIAPTVLKLMNIAIPKDMTGKSLA
ncbi:hypothetical protein P148_SR1C00001G0147 [candidate division SR1 bacterium RAAC1_SR1_1]|nr:hypothetical protein P148_SR1C00001G0147 [candidate division SR1 bacterium RAAC1_SR1_1]